MGTVILIFFILVVAAGLAIFGFQFLNNRAIEKLTEASEDISNMLLDTDYIMVKFTQYSWEHKWPEYGIFTKEQIKAANLNTKQKTLSIRLDDYGSRLPGRLLPRAFLSRLQRIKLGAYTLEQLYQDCQDQHKKTLVKQKESKSI